MYVKCSEELSFASKDALNGIVLEGRVWEGEGKPAGTIKVDAIYKFLQLRAACEADYGGWSRANEQSF